MVANPRPADPRLAEPRLAHRQRRGWPLTRRLVLVLGTGALFVAAVFGCLGADREARLRHNWQAAAERTASEALAERLAPLVERADPERLRSMLGIARDQLQGRILLADRRGLVIADSAQQLAGSPLPFPPANGAVQRALVVGGLEDEPVTVRETAVPVRFGGERIGELRLHHELDAAGPLFDTAWFGLSLLGGVSLVLLAGVMAHYWSLRLRVTTEALLRLSAGEVGGLAGDAADSELQDLGVALREMERGLQDGLSRVADGYAAIALQLVTALERHRLVPAGHGERCVRLLQPLAARLQLTDSDRQELELASRLVDLGKAWVRPGLLQKHGALTTAEAESLRQHPVHAGNQLERMPGLVRVAAIVRHQAECYDGTGTPDGLRGDRIPLGARLLAIAAAYDLLTEGEHAVPAAVAVARLGRGRGEVFDPWLLDLFLEVHRPVAAAAVDRSVMIVPGGDLPWRGEEAASADEVDDGGGEDLEVLRDEDR